MKYSAFFLALSITLLSCAPSLVADMERLNDDPEITPPRVDSFSEAGIIRLAWDRDDCADEYALYRATDGDNPVFSEVYRGTGTSYNDSYVSLEEQYLYVLYKIRGSESFGPSLSVLGIGSSVEQDPYEPNGSYDTATPYEYMISANCWGYNSYDDGHEDFDYDYYSVVVNPHMIGKYRIKGDHVTSLRIQERYCSAIDADDPTELSFSNGTDARKTFYFAVFADKDEVCIDPQGGGSVIDYTLTYIGESPVEE